MPLEDTLRVLMGEECWLGVSASPAKLGSIDSQGPGRLPAPIDNPGVVIHQVQIDLLTERDFGHFCQKTWNRNPAAPPDTRSAATNPS